MSRCMQKSIMTNYRALLCEIDDIIDTNNYFYQMKQERILNGPLVNMWLK